MDNTTDGTWDSLPVKLNDGILETLNELQFTYMTPVQVMLLLIMYLFTVLEAHRLKRHFFFPVCLYSAVYE